MDLTRIVVGIDFSASVNRAVAWLQNHFAPDAQLTLVHALERTPVPSFLRHRYPSGTDKLEDDLRAAATRVGEMITQLGLERAAPLAREGKPHDVLRDVARETAAGLTVIGSHGTLVRPWLRLGSTAERLLRTSETSLLIARGEMREPPRRILTAVDDVAITPELLAQAVSLVERLDGRLLAVHVLSNAAYNHMASIEAAQAPNEETARQRLAGDIGDVARQWLTQIAAVAGSAERLDVEVPHGVPGDEILAAADRFSADLIVIGRYAVGRIIPAVLGSVLGSVAHGARCPVLVIVDK